MNSGMRDVINLAWKLPLVNSGCCAMELLETYQAERHDHVHDLVSWAVEMGHLMQHMADVEAAERLAIEPPQMERTSFAIRPPPGKSLASTCTPSVAAMCLRAASDSAAKPTLTKAGSLDCSAI